ncbi:MAG: DUF1295 domain-containing protein [SAR324 cluster bacterium]|nr:DUF1295 domain-containing protein [SAR324 cluster bacterium]
MIFGIPLLVFLVGIIFLIQWIAFIPAFIFQTEKFFDLIGSMTYLLIMILAVFLSAEIDGRSILLLVLVMIWAIRLGLFLFNRIQKTGKDSRFDKIKPFFLPFLLTWTIQGLWVTFTLAAAISAITTTHRKDMGIPALIGLIIWLSGFVFEVVADHQKRSFRANPDNQGKFIDSGLWALSRHPNYFGEIVLWIGIAVIAIPVLQGWLWLSLISPVFVIILLTRISGIPLLEKAADKQWLEQEAYQAYKERTPLLIPKLWIQQ